MKLTSKTTKLKKDFSSNALVSSKSGKNDGWYSLALIFTALYKNKSIKNPPKKSLSSKSPPSSPTTKISTIGHKSFESNQTILSFTFQPKIINKNGPG